MSAGLLAVIAAASPAAADPALRLRLGSSSLVLPPTLVSTAADVDPGRTVTLRSGSGEEAVQRGGLSLAHLLQVLALPSETVTAIEIQAGTGKVVTISGDEIRGGFSGDPACAACQATLDPGADGTIRLLRPARTSTDRNAADALEPAKGQSLFLRPQSTAAQFGFNVRPSTVTPAAGKRVRFSLSQTESVPSGTVYTWFFGDGTTATGPTATHRFEAGTWSVGVLATAPGAFGTAAIGLNVAAPVDDEPAPTPEPAATRTPAPPASGGASGGGTSGGASSPSPPAAAGSGPGSAGAAGGLPEPRASATATPAATPTPAPATPATPIPAADGLVPISGWLLGAPTGGVPATGAADAAGAAPDSATSDSAAGDASPAVRSAGSGMLLLGILAAGAITERRRAQRALLP